MRQLEDAVDARDGPGDVVGMLARYSNTLTQVRALEELLAYLPSLDEPCAVVERATSRSVRRLNAAQIEQLMAYYQAGRTAYEVAAQCGINRKCVSKQLHVRGVTNAYGRSLPYPD